MNTYNSLIPKIDAYINEHKDEIIADLRTLVEIPSVRGEAKKKLVSDVAEVYEAVCGKKIEGEIIQNEYILN